MQHLFIYGTLAPGRSNHHIIEAISGEWRSAVVKGRLLNEGWGAASGYPAIIPDEDGQAVSGFIVTCPDWVKTLAFRRRLQHDMLLECQRSTENPVIVFSI
jgi:gamma-glutamylcyclotransferase (GGCT)/AIG2-like uncharacterized protein YtfP